MTWSRTPIVGFSLVVTALLAVALLQHRQQAGLTDEYQSLQQQVLTLQSDNGRLSKLLAEAKRAPAAQADSSAELLRLRREVGALRRQTKELQSSLVRIGGGSSLSGAHDPDPDFNVLPENYPQTPTAASQAVLDFLSQGDSNQFFAFFGQPGGRQMYNQLFANEQAKKMAGMKVINIGEPTINPVAPELLLVPYKVRLRDGREQERQLRLFQDPATRRWYFKGGL